MRFTELLVKMAQRSIDYPAERRGQAYFNALYMEHPFLADNIRGTEADPFFDDERIEAFLLKVAENLRP